jgi:transposase
MYDMEPYDIVRLAVTHEGLSHREAARRFGIDPRTVKKMMTFSAPPGYRRSKPVRRPALAGLEAIIDQILADDTQAPVKQRHSAKRIFERLRDEHGYKGSYTPVKVYVRGEKLTHKEMFVPLAHAPGHAQVDFGEAVAIIGGVRQKIHFFCMDLPYSDGCFVKAYPAETTEAFLDGHVSAFSFFGGAPQSILYDNLRIAVTKILGGGKRVKTQRFLALQSHYLFQDRFGRPGKGNDKGNVEGLVKLSRAKFMVPIPRAASYAELNARLEAQCTRRQQDKVRGSADIIAVLFEADKVAFMALPAAPFEPCDKQAGKVSSTSLVRYKGNDYSVPVRFGHRDVIVKGFVDEVVICIGADVIARHIRSYDSADFVMEPLHYLPLIERKLNALDQAAPLADWELPVAFGMLRRLMEARHGNPGKREYVQVLQLMGCFAQDDLHHAVKQALELNVISFDAIKQLVLCRVEQRPARLNLAAFPYLPRATVGVTRVADYAALTSDARRAA